MFDSVWPHRWQPTRLCCLWDSPGKNTGVGCHFLLQCMKVKSESEVAQSCPTLCNPMDCSLPGSSVHGLSQARMLEWVAIAFSASAYLRLLIFLPAILIPVCASSSSAFCMKQSAYKLNKQGDNIQPWCTPFPIWNQSVVPCPVLTIASWPAYSFLMRQVTWSGIPISWRISIVCHDPHSQRLWSSQ